MSYLEVKRESKNYHIDKKKIKHNSLIIDYHLKLSSINLAAGQELNNNNCLYNTLAYINPYELITNKSMSLNKEKKRGLCDKISIIACYFLNIYYIFYSLIIIFVHYLRDLRLKTIRKIINNKFNLNNYDDLKLKESIKSIKFLNNLLHMMGDPVISLTGTTINCFMIIVTVLITHFILTIIQVINNTYRSDFCSFLLQPAREAIRLKNDLIDITITLIKSIDSNSSTQDLQEKIKSISMKNNSLPEQNNDQKLKCCFEFKKENLNDSKTIFKYTLIYIIRFDLVKPTVISKKWHNFIDKLFFCCMIGVAMYAIITALIFCSYLLIKELNIRVSRRLTEMCKRNYSILDVNHNKQTNLSYYYELSSYDKKDKLFLMNYCYDKYNDMFEYLKLHLIEFTYYLTISNTISWCSTILICIYLSQLFAFHFNFHVFSHLDRIGWLNQIIQDINCCIKMIYELDGLKHGGNNNINLLIYNKCFLLSRDITIVYLNNELFFRQYRNFLKISNFLTIQGFLLGAFVLLQTYTIGVYVGSESNTFVLIVTTYVVLYIDVYLSVTAILIKKIERLRIDIIRLLSAANTNSLDWHIFILWRRHLLSKVESRELYAPNIIGLYITFDRILTINIYLALLWIILF